MFENINSLNELQKVIFQILIIVVVLLMIFLLLRIFIPFFFRILKDKYTDYSKKRITYYHKVIDNSAGEIEIKFFYYPYEKKKFEFLDNLYHQDQIVTIDNSQYKVMSSRKHEYRSLTKNGKTTRRICYIYFAKPYVESEKIEPGDTYNIPHGIINKDTVIHGNQNNNIQDSRITEITNYNEMRSYIDKQNIPIHEKILIKTAIDDKENNIEPSKEVAKNALDTILKYTEIAGKLVIIAEFLHKITSQ